MKERPKVIAVVGPTASGKSNLAIEIAKQCNGEVISADSRQVYRGLDIGTGKVTEKEMDGVPHHLLDICDPEQVYTGADFVRDATATIDDILGRGKLPVVAGGTFFYIELLRGTMQPAPVPPNPELRAKLEDIPTDVLFKTLEAKDPRRAATIDSENRRRLVRALEIIDALGAVPPPEPIESPYDMLLIGTDQPQEQLRTNIHVRLHKRLKYGMIDEAKRLHDEGLSYTRMDELGLEYRYLAKYLQGEMNEEEMTETLETKIRQYAKRQLTWLKRDTDIEWFSPEDTEAVFRRIEEFLGEA